MREVFKRNTNVLHPAGETEMCIITFDKNKETDFCLLCETEDERSPLRFMGWTKYQILHLVHHDVDTELSLNGFILL